ncbi:9-cis-epoxycarotenoid dioxygenase NCED4, chloroplastic [Sesamum angolense]|uniref:9-cis-epoxycarotenoid dioxygenase NCED4, chloroplastic n=1 Tax=Sesamum angolense TaxID=2727404 RepID=A0AAE1W947_9LAMI|nr:9-cis-epoxycarotenoid dioxygenase NCED4, chloroplastic [Sesamum angolense]
MSCSAAAYAFPLMVISCSCSAAESSSSSRRPPRIGLPKPSTSTNYSSSSAAYKISGMVVDLARTIRETPGKLLDALVDQVFEFCDQPYLPSQVYTCCFFVGSNPLHGAPKSAVSVFGKSNSIWVEGEGMIHALYCNKDHSSTDGSSWTTFYNNKYVSTDTFQLEKERKKPVFLPATEGDPPAVLSAFLLNLMRFGVPNKNMSNTNVFEHAGKYYTAADSDVAPHQIHIPTLETIGTWDEIAESWNRPFTSHPKKAPGTGELVIIGFDAKNPYLVLGVISGNKANGEYRKIEYHMFPENTFCTGASFVAKQGAADEDDGWLITFVHNEDTNVSEVYIVDAKKISGEAVAKIRLPCRVPYGFHGAYMPASSTCLLAQQ